MLLLNLYRSIYTSFIALALICKAAVTNNYFLSFEYSQNRPDYQLEL